MKLRFSPTSPYVRKVMACAIELGLEDRIEPITTNPWDVETDLPDDNPLGKVPTLVLDDGRALFDSPVICEYLDSLNELPRLFPSGAARWPALRLQAMADGIMDAAVARLRESKRCSEKRSESWIERQREIMRRALDALNNEAPAWDGAINIGHVAAGTALGYLDFRYAADGWRQGRPAICAWYDRFSQRDSMQRTAPEGQP